MDANPFLIPLQGNLNFTAREFYFPCDVVFFLIASLF